MTMTRATTTSDVRPDLPRADANDGSPAAVSGRQLVGRIAQADAPRAGVTERAPSASEDGNHVEPNHLVQGHGRRRTANAEYDACGCC